jgi:hypothetical protein
MKPAQKLTLLLPLVRIAHEAAPALPPKQRAEIYEGIALITQGLDAHLHGHADAAAKALRAAEGHQLTFAALLHQSTATHP